MGKRDGNKNAVLFSWGLQDVSDSASGRTQDTIMHKNRVGQKRKIALGWNNPTKEEAAAILQAFNPEYINVTYPDAMSGTDETREFYVGDRSAPMKMWTVKRKSTHKSVSILLRGRWSSCLMYQQNLKMSCLMIIEIFFRS